ncbi:MAG: ABC transporter substrate-binding protein [Deltaproteobacteria bacterium]|nr:ABC transporter substrate-binding protein [Deltaproteobacteria bacterium]
MRRKKKGWLFMMILVIGGMVLIHATDVWAKPPKGVLKQVIHWGISADWLDPATAGYPISAHLPLYLFHDALVKAMPEGNFTPCLAESWTVSPDAQVYEFKLRKGVKFHNGDILTAEDVLFSVRRYKAAQAKLLKDKIANLEAVNPYLVRFTFKEPFPDFLEYLCPGVTSLAWVVPKNYVEKVGDAGFKKHPIGCGPFKFVEFVPGVRLVGEAFEDYWRKVPNIKRLEFIQAPEPATRLAMVKRGEADIGTLMQGVFYEDAKKDPKLKLFHPLSPTRWIVYFSNQWDPKSPCSNPKVRKAMSLAIDRQTLADVHMPGCKGIGVLGLEGDPGLADFPADPYDPEKAKKLLAEAGYPSGFHAGPFFPYEGGYWPMGEQIANYWKAIGITVETKLLDRPAWVANREGRKMTNAIFIDPATAPTIGGRVTYLFGTTSYGNYPHIEKAWEEYQKTGDSKKRKELIWEIQRMIHDRTMFIPLVNTNSPAAFGPRVKGNPYKVQPLIWFTAPLEDIELAE